MMDTLRIRSEIQSHLKSRVSLMMLPLPTTKIAALYKIQHFATQPAEMGQKQLAWSARKKNSSQSA